MPNLQARLLEPEWLDALPPEDASARDSRRDLRKLNFLMGHRRSLLALLRIARVEDRSESLVDLGAGDGCFALEMIKGLRMKCSKPRLMLVDRQLSVNRKTRDRIEALGWQVEEVKADVFDFARQLSRSSTFIMANLFLHHFEAGALRALFGVLAPKVDGLAACEPRRARTALSATAFLPLLGCNGVTRHDAHVSVRAGFCAHELSELWPTAGEWQVREKGCGLFSHSFVAWRK